MEKWEYLHKYIAIVGRSEKEMLEEILPLEEQNRIEKIYNWEVELEEKLQKYGDQGWELIFIEPRLVDGTGLDGYALFKRKKEVTR